MLGSAADAEDILQEAQLRLHRAQPQPENPEAFLYRVVSNLCVDQLRREQARRKAYVGPWLPEPFTEPAVGDDAELAEMAEQLSIGFLLMLERLTPAERVAFVLREGFDFSFAEIASLLDVTPANARQRAHRARKRLAEVSVPVQRPQQQKQLLERLVECVARGDVDGLVGLMSEDVIAYSDGGGVVSAAIVPVHGAARIAQVFMHLARKAQAQGPLRFELQRMNGGWGLLIKEGDELNSCLQLEAGQGLIRRLYVMRNPEKLRLVSAARLPTPSAD